MAKVYKKRLEDAIFKLLDLARELEVSVQFKDPNTCEEVWAEIYGYFDCQTNHIVCYKSMDKPLNIQHVHTLAHELRHAFQFRNKMWPTHWLANIGVYPKYKNKQKELAMEEDADQDANEFMIKNKLPVPTDFSPDKV